MAGNFTILNEINNILKNKEFSYKIGTDVELFLSKNRRVISSLGFERIKNEFGVIERDGMPIEIQPNPAKNPEELWHNIKKLNLLLKGKENISKKSVILADLNFLTNLGDKESLQFGCKPDENIYKDRTNMKKDATTTAIRSCGGHLHIEIPDYIPHIIFEDQHWKIFGKPDNRKMRNIIKATIRWADIFLGTLSVLMDKETRRREIYGNAGDFRYTQWGIEYRTLSNFWFFLNKKEMITIFKIWQACLKLAICGNYPKGNLEVKKAIDLYDKNKSKDILKNNLNLLTTL